MYFGVFLVDLSYHVVIPKTWVQGIDNHWEKFVNKSLNRNQIFRCFYGGGLNIGINAWDVEGRPNINYTPNFELSTECHPGKLVFFKQNYDVAIEIIRRRRSIAPRLYNVRRLNEVPIPDIEPAVNKIPAQEHPNAQSDSDSEQEEFSVHVI